MYILSCFSVRPEINPYGLLDLKTNQINNESILAYKEGTFDGPGKLEMNSKLDVRGGGTPRHESLALCSVFTLFVFYQIICLSVCRFVKGNTCQTGVCTLFCLVKIKRHSY